MSQTLAGLLVGQSYSKAELRILLSESTLVSKTAGIFYCKNTTTVLLFVTLVKAPNKPNYNDYFELSGKYFHWDSQNKQHINTPAIQNIVQGRTTPHLFVRMTEKRNNSVQPFTYFGALVYDDYDKQSANPVHIRFLLNTPPSLEGGRTVQDLIQWRPLQVGTAPTHRMLDVEPSASDKRSYQPPTTTERSGLVTSRVGQGYYRDRVIERWGGVCPVTGVAQTAILIASHIVPWKDSNDTERLDPNNGILLSPNVDALFDRHLISFEDDGTLIISSHITVDDMKKLGIHPTVRIAVTDGMRSYLTRHRKHLKR